MAKADGSLVKALRALKHQIRMLRAEHKADLAQLPDPRGPKIP